MILKNENDIYIYFETIAQLEPKTILDVGMFLKRIGSVSRKAMDGGVPEDVRLDGVDFFRCGKQYTIPFLRKAFLTKRMRFDMIWRYVWVSVKFRRKKATVFQ